MASVNPPAPGTALSAGNSAVRPESARGSHTAHFYANDASLASEVGQRIAAALVAGGAAVIIADQPHRRELAESVEHRGIDLTRVANQGRWLALDATKALSEFMAGGEPDPQRFALLVGGILDRLASAVRAHGNESAPIVAYGEMVAVLWQEGQKQASLRLEDLWNDLARGRPFHLSCGWPLRFFSRREDAAALHRICSQHTHVTPARGYNNLSDDERGRGAFLWQLKAHNVLEHVSQISRQTLGFYRSPSPAASLSFSEAVDEVLAIYERRLRLKDIEVARKIRPGLAIRWPQGECKHILSSLVANAIDASSQESTIYVAAHAARHPGTTAPGLRLLVGDQGTGIPAAQCSRVFAPYFVERKDINIGLGLWTVKDLLDKRGGFIRCRSRMTIAGSGRPSGTLMTAFLPTDPAITAAA
ncbi:MAG TPA: ATP-binding protein [Acidobacteriaceae bacterium]